MKRNLLIGVAWLAMSVGAQAAPVSTGNLTGGGALWSVGNTSAGFAIVDAQTQSQSDAFDYGLTFYVNGVAYNTPGGTFDLSGQKATGGTALMSGLNVFTSYYADTASPALRTLFTMTNTTSQAITRTVSMRTNVGSDSSTQTVATSSGDTAFTKADRWIVTDDGAGGDPANLHVLWGTGGLAPSAVGQTVFEAAGTQGVLADFVLTLEAGQTSSLMMVNQIFNTASAATGNANQFNTLGANSALLADLSSAERARIVNWKVGAAAATVPEPASLLLVAVAGLALAGARRRKSA